MSIRRAWYVACDRCGNPAPISAESAQDARALAQVTPFTTQEPLTYFARVGNGGKWLDLCPNCQDAR